jgi:hypothetical protein
MVFSEGYIETRDMDVVFFFVAGKYFVSSAWVGFSWFVLIARFYAQCTRDSFGLYMLDAMGSPGDK